MFVRESPILSETFKEKTKTDENLQNSDFSVKSEYNSINSFLDVLNFSVV